MCSVVQRLLIIVLLSRDVDNPTCQRARFIVSLQDSLHNMTPSHARRLWLGIRKRRSRLLLVTLPCSALPRTLLWHFFLAESQLQVQVFMQGRVVYLKAQKTKPASPVPPL